MACGSGSGALAEDVAAEIADRDLVAVGVISSNRNFDGRLNASLRGTFLASPPLVVAYAIAGSILHDLTREKLGDDAAGRPVLLADIWPADAEIRAGVDRALTRDLFHNAYDSVRRPRSEMVRDSLRRGAGVPLGCRRASILRRPPFLDDQHGCGGAGPRRAHAAHARRRHHHGPHLARRLDTASTEAGDLSHRARRAAAEVRHLYRPPRQPRGDDPRHVREHPLAQRARAGPRGRIHAPSAERRDA